MNIWRMTGYFSLVLLAGMQKISTSVVEAAEVDGARATRKFCYITVPQLVPEIFFVLLISTIWIFQNVGDVMVLTNGGPHNSSINLVLYIYRNAYEFSKIGYASALAYLLTKNVVCLSKDKVRSKNMNGAIHNERLILAQASVDAAAKTVSGTYRQKYHFMAPAYWINDPNGCIFVKGEYHLFYQHNPYAPVWGSMHWGHAVSKDLIHWEHLPIALAPSEPYDDHPEGGVFSGTTVYHDGILYAFYTGTTKCGNSSVQTQCLATSKDDGLTFVKYFGNPIIRDLPPGASPNFRDPKVLRVGDIWYMIIGCSDGGGARNGGDGCVHMYRSDDLKDWRYCGVIARSNGELGTMWECPDLFKLGEKWVLIFSPMFYGEHKTVYQVGNMDFEAARFSCECQGEIDWGCEYYAPQSIQDQQGRTILMAWQNGWDWMPWWKGFGPTKSDNWCGAMALPREVTLEPDNRLAFRPVREIEAVRTDISVENDIIIREEKHRIPFCDPICFELSVELDLAKITAEKLHLYLRANQKRYTRVTIDFRNKLLIFDRENADTHSKGIRVCTVELRGDKSELRIFSDTSSIELFADGGRTTMCNTIYPTHTDQGGYLCAEGGEVEIISLCTWKV